ncbi:MAG TPA: hypothetical protein VKS20_07070 [Candidatus Acidoferrales bacterium]|nr:hypothetical protein [Candidatus Acidoferrales bacterium]
MSRMRAIAIGVVVSSALICAALLMAQQQRTPVPPPPQRGLQRMQAVETSRDSRMIGVSVVRLINTAEIDYKNAHDNKYASWDELLRSGVVGDEQAHWGLLRGMRLSPGQEVVPGWTLSLVVSADGQSYELSLRNLIDPCAFSFFSDRRGVIYQGGVIDCSVELKPAQ